MSSHIAHSLGAYIWLAGATKVFLWCFPKYNTNAKFCQKKNMSNINKSIIYFQNFTKNWTNKMEYINDNKKENSTFCTSFEALPCAAPKRVKNEKEGFC